MPSDGAASSSAQFIDDETLFASYVLQREQPHVIVALRSFVQAANRRNGDRPVTYHEREQETACAMRVLGCTWEQWEYRDTDPDWTMIATSLGSRGNSWERVYAPLPEEDGGHPHHDQLGRLAGRLWPRSVVYYSTYTHGHERSRRGGVVAHPYGHEQGRAEALACYTSQRELGSTSHHFDSALADPVEYELVPPR